MCRARVRLPSLIVGLALVVGACVVGPTEGTSEDPFASVRGLPLQVMMGREVVQFNSIEQGAAGADVVGRFIVRDVDEGRIGELTTYTLLVDTLEVLAGDPPSSPFTIVTDAAYWRPDFVGTNRDWLRAGGEVLLLLVKRTDTGALRPVNSQSIYRVEGSTTFGIWEGAVASRFDGAPLGDLRSAILSAP